MNKDGRLGPEQAGFRPDFCTLDHIFTSHAIIEYYKNKKGRVYCAFIDYTKAFDLIDRSALWMKLINNVVSGKILNVIFNMHKHAKSCVKNDGKMSDFFHVIWGFDKEKTCPLFYLLFFLMILKSQ